MPTKQYPAPGWRDYIAQWLDSLKAGAYAASTINTRRCQLTAISQALGGSPLDVEASDLVAYFAGREWKPETRKGARNACAGFFGWMFQTGHIDTDPSRALPSIRRPHPHPRPCPDVVILKALSKATDRERLMLRLGAEAGLRRFEIAKISDADLVRDLMGWSLMVIGKGDVQRMVPISDDLAGEIRAHGPGYIFPGRWGSHVEASYVGKHLSRLLDGWSAHSLRHRYATRTWEATHDLLPVSRLLGHASVETTQRYVAMPCARLRDAVSATLIA
ncbi:Phage integrase [Bifidobacterium breve]|uniref:tyrosine-type recombinase/integrase n=1 Tax=Bifidobacterium breve TaxID=1685 RepID=UPI000CA1C847|nr:tyrosine-type recombinase/integrase [Bifidobacterium breve]AUD84394.1 Phage integrase [Bifidobacterium breve]